jgi:hypothetical protein
MPVRASMKRVESGSKWWRVLKRNEYIEELGTGMGGSVDVYMLANDGGERHEEGGWSRVGVNLGVRLKIYSRTERAGDVGAEAETRDGE